MYYGNIHSNSYFISLIFRERLFHCNICIHVLYCRIYRLKESGILNHMYLHGLPNYTKCLQPSLVSPSKGLRPFELEDFYGVFCVYFGGEDLSMEVQAYKRIYIYLCVYACCVWAIAMYQIWIIASDTNLSFGLILLILFTEIRRYDIFGAGVSPGACGASSNVWRGGKAERGHSYSTFYCQWLNRAWPNLTVSDGWLFWD